MMQSLSSALCSLFSDLSEIMKTLRKEESKTKSDILIEFLEVVFHSILYFRDIYPKSMFCLKKKYQIPVHVSMHPEVNNYITECLKTAQELLKWDGVKQLALVIVTEEDVKVEKYCFDLEESRNQEMDHYFVKTEEIFRQYLLKLSVVDLKKLPENCTFRIEITTKEDCSVRLNESVDQAHFPWIESDIADNVENCFRILPIKTLESSLLTLNMYIER